MGGLGLSGAARRRRAGGVAPVPLPSPALSAINADGWSAERSDASGALPPGFVVTRAGFDATARPVAHAARRTVTRRRRRLYPDQAADTATSVALDDYVYATDTVAGVANNSAEFSPKPVAAWVMPDRLLVGDALRWELIAFHRDFQDGRQVACVVVTASDGAAAVSQTVSGTALSTSCEDANPIEVYGGELDISALATGLVTLTARVYPWIGGPASVLDTATAASAREFGPRHFLRDPARFAAPPLAYVASAGSDATGKWSGSAAAAAAAPFLTIGGALAAVADAGRGAPATGGVTDGCRIRVMDGVGFGTVPAARAQNVAAVVVERDPAIARSAAVVTLSAAFRPRLGIGTLAAPLTEGALMFDDVTVNRAANTTFTGEAATPLRLLFHNATITNNGVAGSWLANAHDYFFGLRLTGFNGNLGQTTNQHRMMRGLQCDFAGGNAPEAWVTTGSRLTRVKGAGHADPTKGAIHYANKYLSPDPTTAPIDIATVGAGETITGFVVAQNLIEVTHATMSTPALRIGSDTPQHGDTLHVVVAHNTITGYGSAGRSNLLYDNSPEVRRHRLMRDVGNIYVQLNTKGDVFTQDASHVGQLAYAHGVGCQGNWSMFQTNSAIAHSETQTFPGAGSIIGGSAAVRHDPLFVDYRGTGGTGGTASAGSGGGDYALRPESPARGLVSRGGLRFDLAGAARSATSDTPGAYG